MEAMVMGVVNGTNKMTLHTNDNTTTIMTPVAQLPDLSHIQHVIYIFGHVLLPIVCCLGILGNGLSVWVLTRRQMAGPATCFLTGLAVSDLVLLTLQIPSFFHFNKDIAASDSYQMFYRYFSVTRYVLNNVFITCTCWLTVAVTVERFISLRFMMHPKLVCTISRARKVIIAIFLVSFIFHFSKFFEYVPNRDLKSREPLKTTHLVHTPAYETYVHIANIALAAIIPVFILFLANFFLIYFLSTHRKRMLRHKESGAIKSTVTSADMIHVTAIVVATVLVFISCHSVGVYMALSIAAKGRRWAFGQPIFRALNHINTFLIMLNSSVNFLLYCTISRKFRNTLMKMVKKQVKKRRDTWTTAAMPLSDNSTCGTLRTRNPTHQSQSLSHTPSTGSI